MLIERTRKGVEQRLPYGQAAYRKGYEHIFIHHNILEQSTEWQAPLFVNLIYFNKAFDGVERTRLWILLRYCGIPHVLVETMKNICNENTSWVINGGNTSVVFSRDRRRAYMFYVMIFVHHYY